MTKIIRNFNNIKLNDKKSIVTIGSFDGVHLGHQQILNKLKKISQNKNLISYVIFFEPLPKEFFLKEQAPKRISSLRDKILNISKMGIDNIICIKFNKKLINTTADNFIKEFLMKKLNIAHIIIGDDFKFGKNRQGDFNLLEKFSHQFNFKVDKVSTFTHHDKRISSSYIRECIESHNLDIVKNLIGSNLIINSRVIHGNKNGRKIGFPTANIKLQKNSILKGVYLTKVEIDNKKYFGITNAGTRPTIDGKNNLLETFIFDFNDYIYNKHIKVEVLKFIRAEKKFSSFIALKEQIFIDVNKAKQLIKSIK